MITSIYIKETEKNVTGCSEKLPDAATQQSYTSLSTVGLIITGRYSLIRKAHRKYIDASIAEERFTRNICSNIFTATTKRYYSARIALRLMGCSGANDPKNLVPSCFRCNERKGTSWNLIYLIRAKYGDSQDYWKAVKIARITFAVTILALLVVCLTRKGAR